MAALASTWRLGSYRIFTCVPTFGACYSACDQVRWKTFPSIYRDGSANSRTYKCIASMSGVQSHVGDSMAVLSSWINRNGNASALQVTASVRYYRPTLILVSKLVPSKLARTRWSWQSPEFILADRTSSNIFCSDTDHGTYSGSRLCLS